MAPTTRTFLPTNAWPTKSTTQAQSSVESVDGQ